MKIKCPNCTAAYDMDESRVPVAGVTIKCPRCQSPFRVTKQGVAPPAGAAPAASQPGSPSLPPTPVPQPPAAGAAGDVVPLPAPERGPAPRAGVAPPAGRPPGAMAPPPGRPPGAGAPSPAAPAPAAIPGMAAASSGLPDLPPPSFDSTLPPGWDTTGHPAQQRGPAPAPRAPLSAQGLGETVPLPSRSSAAAAPAPAPTMAFRNPFDQAGSFGATEADPFAFPPAAPADGGFEVDFGAGAGTPAPDFAPAPGPTGFDLADIQTLTSPRRDPALDAALSSVAQGTPGPTVNPFQAAVNAAASRGVPGGVDDTSMLDFVDDQARGAAGGGSSLWQIRRKSGKVFGPFDAPAIQAMLQQGQLFGNEEVSLDGANWVPMSLEPALAGFVKSDSQPGGRTEPPGLANPGAPRVPPPVIPVMGAAPASSKTNVPAGTVPFEVSAAPNSRGGLGRRALPVWVRLMMRRLPLVAAGAVGIGVIGGGIALGKFTDYGYFGAKLFSGKSVNGHSPATKTLEKFDVLAGEGTYGAAQKALGAVQEALSQDSDLPEAIMDYAVISCRLNHRYSSAKADVEKARELVKKHLDKDSLEGKIAHAAVVFCEAPGKANDARSLLTPLATNPRAELLYGDILLTAKDFKGAASHLDAVLKAHPSGEAAMLRAEAAHNLGDAAAEEAALLKAQDSVAGHARARLWLARLRVSQNKLDEAAELLKSVLADANVRALDASEEAMGHHLRGDVLAAQRQFQEAAKEYLRAADVEPENGKHRAALAFLYMRLHQWSDAAPAFEKALEKNAGDTELLVGFGRALTAVGNYQKATEKLEEAKKKAPSDPAVLVAIGDLQVALLHNPDAHKAYKDALSKNEKYVPALVGEARLLLKEGKPDEAKARVDKAVEVAASDPTVQAVSGHYWLAVGDAAKAKEAFTKATAVDLDTATSFAGLGEALQLLGDDVAAKDAFTKAVTIDGKDISLRKQFAELLRHMNDLDGALTQLQAALQVETKDARLQALVGAVLLDLNRPTEAGAALKQALALKDDEAIAQEYYGRLLALNGDTSQAVDHLKRAVEIEPKNAEIRYQLGLAFERGQLLVDATEAFKQAIQLDPNMLDAYEHLGSALAVQNFYADAMEAYKGVLKRDPKRASALGALGDCEFKAGSVADAIHHFEEAIKVAQKDLPEKDEAKRSDQQEFLSTLYFKVGRAYDKKGDADKAEKSYREAVKLDPKNASPYYYLGYIYKGYKGGPKRKEAIEAFQNYLKYNKDAKDADEITDQIAYLRDGQ